MEHVFGTDDRFFLALTTHRFQLDFMGSYIAFHGLTHSLVGAFNREKLKRNRGIYKTLSMASMASMAGDARHLRAPKARSIRPGGWRVQLLSGIDERKGPLSFQLAAQYNPRPMRYDRLYIGSPIQFDVHVYFICRARYVTTVIAYGQQENIIC